MKQFLFSTAFLLTLSLSVFAQTKKPVAPKTTKPAVRPAARPVAATALKTGNDSLSYAIGVNLGQSFLAQSLQNVNTVILSRAINDVLKGQKGPLNDDQAGAVLQNFMGRMRDQQTKEQAKQFEPIKKAGEAYLAANKTKDSVVTLPSGLQYKILKKGEGAKPSATDRVKAHYHGMLIDGTVFDSSVERGEPITLPVGGVIPGWVEALQLMPVGSKWKLFIPYQLAYGERGSQPTIPPYSALVFDVELLGIEK